MKAILLPLSGKYYGTEIRILDDDGEPITDINIWLNGGDPSKRELKSWGYTEQQWEQNELVDNGYDGKSYIRSMGLIGDSHYETKKSYEYALRIVEKLNQDVIKEI